MLLTTSMYIPVLVDTGTHGGAAAAAGHAHPLCGVRPPAAQRPPRRTPKGSLPHLWPAGPSSRRAGRSSAGTFQPCTVMVRALPCEWPGGRGRRAAAPPPRCKHPPPCQTPAGVPGWTGRAWQRQRRLHPATMVAGNGGLCACPSRCPARGRPWRKEGGGGGHAAAAGAAGGRHASRHASCVGAGGPRRRLCRGGWRGCPPPP